MHIDPLHTRKCGFAFASLLYLLGIIGVGAGVLFSDFSHILRSGQHVESVTIAKSEPQATAQPPAAACGTSVDDKLTAAKNALQANDTAATLACLIEATTALNEQTRNLALGRAASGELRAPVTDLPLTPGR